MVNFFRKNFRTTKQRAPFKLESATAWLMLLCQCLNLSTVVNQLTSWMLAIIALSLCWRTLMVHYDRPKPPFWLLLLFALTGCSVLVFTGKELGLLSSMLHLLCFSYALKTLELSSRKDFYQLILLGLFVLAVALIFQQSMLFALAIGLIILVNLAVLMRYFTPQQELLALHKNASKLILQSIPLAIVLFIVFPRLAPFWQVPQAQSSKTGMSDTVKPGEIASLALSDDLAFRVSFQSKKPSLDQLYWRGLVLENYDGHAWSRGETYNTSVPWTGNAQQDLAARLSYQVILDPSYRPWLFALDRAQVNQVGLVNLADHSIRSRKPVSQTLSYQVVSFTDQPLDRQAPKGMLQRNLLYPVGSNPRLEQEAKVLRKNHVNDITLIQAVLANFRQQDFYYTLQPPLLIDNSLDQFYFDIKAGFCEHYASAFTYLMRAAGIPARMVVGYLGGEYNAEGDYFSVFQYDAHAWVEIWQTGRGWLRIDPTAAVSPDRVENGLSSRLLQEQSLLSGDLLSLHRFKHLAWINSLRIKLDAMDYQWTRLVLGYSAKRQYSLLSNLLGRVLPWKIAAIMVFSLLLVFALFWLINQGKKRRKQASPSLVIYQQALQLFAAKGLNKAQSMPAKTFALQASEYFPLAEHCFGALSDNFSRATYQRLTQSEQQYVLLQMKQALKALKGVLKNSPCVESADKNQAR